MIQLHQFQIGSMSNFVYLLSSGKDAVVVDPQPDLKPWEAALAASGASLKGVLLTHTHYDHVGGVSPILVKYPNAKIHLHDDDLFRLELLRATAPHRFQKLEDAQSYALGQDQIEIWHTPGHSAGECCFLLKDQKPWRLLTGDTVFVGLVGRTDLETGDDAELFKTLQRIKTLPQDTIIYPGHNYGATPTSTIAHEIKTSAAFQCKTVAELIAVP